MGEHTLWQGQPVVKIQKGAAEAWIDVAHGGKLLQWRIDGRDMLYWPDQPDWSRPAKIRGGNPILFPFIARHLVDGELGVWRDGETLRKMPMHGFARESAFQQDSITPDSVTLSLSDNDSLRECYPFAFQFQVQYQLHNENSLSINFQTENRDSRPLPVYPGHHFYFPVKHDERDQWRLEIPCDQTASQLPNGEIEFDNCISLPENLSDPVWVDRFHLLQSGPPITLRHKAGTPCYQFHLDHENSIPWYAITTWTETPESDFFCVEPWLGLPNAIHHGHGLRQIAPGEKENALCRIEVEL